MKIFWIWAYIFFSLLPFGCYTGGGGGRSVAPRVVDNTISITKEEVFLNRFQEIDEIPVSYLQAGYLKKSKKYVKFIEKPGYPDSYVDCIDQFGNLLWSRSESWPNNSINGIFIDNREESSRIIYVTHNIGINGTGKNSLVFLDETGQTKQVIRLDTGKYLRKDYYCFSLVAFNENEYILAVSSGKGLGIFNFKGELMTYLNTPRYTTYGVGLELRGENRKSLVAIFAAQQATSHSSTLFILNSNWEIVYKEYLAGGQWIAKAKGDSGDDLIISTEKGCCPSDRCEPIEGYWRYSVF